MTASYQPVADKDLLHAAGRDLESPVAYRVERGMFHDVDAPVMMIWFGVTVMGSFGSLVGTKALRRRGHQEVELQPQP
jgi:hypothetical protein